MIICCHQQFMQCSVCSIGQLCQHLTCICYKQEPMMHAISQSVCSQSGKDLPSKPNNCTQHLHKYMYLCTYIHTYIITYSMEHSPSWEANWFAASQEILRNPKVHYHIRSACMHVCMYVCMHSVNSFTEMLTCANAAFSTQCPRVGCHWSLRPLCLPR